jgi:protein-L-isoaspartate(D-aspartate) O-methyltransferase
VLTGSTPIVPEGLVRQMKPGGRMFAVVGDRPVMTARLLHWVEPDSVTATDLFETVIDPLVNAAQPSRFRF